MDVLYPRCAGLDVHKDTVVAGVRLAGGGAVRTEVRTFSTTTPGLLALSAGVSKTWGTTPRVGLPGGRSVRPAPRP